MDLALVLELLIHMVDILDRNIRGIMSNRTSITSSLRNNATLKLWILITKHQVIILRFRMGLQLSMRTTIKTSILLAHSSRALNMLLIQPISKTWMHLTPKMSLTFTQAKTLSSINMVELTTSTIMGRSLTVKAVYRAYTVSQLFETKSHKQLIDTTIRRLVWVTSTITITITGTTVESQCNQVSMKVVC